MSLFPYSDTPLVAFDDIEADALALENLARERDASADAIERMPGGSPQAARAHRLTAKRLRRAAACLGYISGRVDRLDRLNEPVRQEVRFGGSSIRRTANGSSYSPENPD